MLQLFKFESKQVRCLGTWETPEWVANDVIDILYPESDKRNRTNYLKKVPQKWKGHKKIMTPTGLQDVVTLREPGLYFFINRSSSSVAEPFQDWLCEEVLPSIRKTGSYEATQVDDESTLAPKEISEAIASVLSIAGIDPTLIAGVAANEIGKAYPMLKPHMEAAKKLLPLPVEEELLTVTDLAKKYVRETGKQLSKNNTERGNAMALNKLLIELGLQVKNQAGDPNYLPTESGKNYSKFVLQEGNSSNKTCQQLRWYPKVIEKLA